MTDTAKTEDSSKKVVINLDMTVPSNVKDITGLIQRRALDVMFAKIKKRAEWIAENKAESKKSKNSDSEEHFAKLYSKGWTVFIDGTRGAGKSTFMQVLLSHVKEKGPGLTVFDMIDPNKTEPVEILLLIILDRIKSKVDERLKKQQSESNTGHEKRWRDSFKKVAGGLALLNKDHKPLKDLDSDLFLDLGLERAGDSAKLRENLHKLFECATDILETEALLFAFDDADISAETTIQLLETIRKYLDTPLVMVLVTGDMELYSLLAREHMKCTLSFDFLKYGFLKDPDHDKRMPQKLRMLSHLEEQYLLKLFPLNERIHLRTIKYLLEKDDEKGSYFLTHPSWKGGKDKKKLKEYVHTLIQNGLHLKSKEDVKLYSEFFLSQPVRGIVQVLSQTVRADTDTDTDTKDGSLDFFEASLDFTLQSLYHFDFDTDALLENNLRVLFAAVFKICILDGNPDTSAYLRPLSADPHIQAAMFSLSAAVAQQLNGKPGDCIAYILRGPGMVKLFSMYPHANTEHLYAPLNQHHLHPKDYKIEQDRAEREFRRYMEIGRSDKALGCARLVSVLLAHLQPLQQNHKASKPAIEHGVIELQPDSYEEKFKSAAAENKGLVPAAAFCLVQSSGTGTRTFASIFNMLGLVSRLLTHAQSSDWHKKEKKEIVRELLAASFINSVIVSAPPWLVKRDSTTVTRTSPSHGRNAESATLIEPWIEPLVTWMDSVSEEFEKVRPSSVFLGKVWTRLFFSLEIASDAAQEKGMSFSESMELFALCATHAFLIEEYSYHQLTDATEKTDGKEEAQKPIHIDNPKDKATYLAQIQAFRNELFGDDPLGKKLPLTWIVATCPLMHGLISEKIDPFKLPNLGSHCFASTNVFKKLKNISIRKSNPTSP